MPMSHFSLEQLGKPKSQPKPKAPPPQKEVVKQTAHGKKVLDALYRLREFEWDEEALKRA